MPRRDFKWDAFEKLRVKSSNFGDRTKRSSTMNVNHARRFIVSRWESVQAIRQRIAFWLIGMGILIAFVALQFVWMGRSYGETAPVRGGTYIEGMVGSVSTLNPLYASTTPEKSIAHLVYSSLYKYDERGGLKGDLATAMTVENKDKTYIVNLRHNATWQDGQPVTADDVMYTIGLMQNPTARSPLYASWKNIKVSKVNEHAVKFELASVYAPFPHALTFPILPKHVLAKVEPSRLRESIDGTNLIGSGPYKIVSMQEVAGDNAHDVIRLTRSTNYYGGLPNVERIQVYTYDDHDGLMQALANGDVDAGSGLSIINTTELQTDRYHVQARPVASGVYALFNTTNGPLKDQKVRTALQLGTDVQALIKSYPIALQRLVGPFTDHQIDTTGIKLPQYDPQRAAAILTKAGWKMGKDQKRHKGKESLQLAIVTVKDADYEKAAAELAMQWQKLGIDATVNVVDASDPAQNVASSVLQPRNYDVLVYELFLGGDPDVYAYWHSSQADSHGLNLTNFNDPVSDDILVSARSRLEPKLREAKYRSLANRWLEKAPAIGLYESEFVYVAKPRIHSVRDKAYFVMPETHFTDVNYWTVKQGDVYKTP